MERTYYIELSKYGQPKELHSFTMKVCGNGWYRAITSFNAFSRHNAKTLSRLIDKHKSYTAYRRMPRYGRTRSETDIKLDFKLSAMFPGIHPELQCHHHSSIWSLYQAIGYDYKKKKWVNKND